MSTLGALRRRIDAVDARIVRLLARRQKLVAAMAPLKSRVHDPEREAAVRGKWDAAARAYNAHRPSIRAVVRAVLLASRRRQRTLAR